MEEAPIPAAQSPSLADLAPVVLRSAFNEAPNTFLTQHHISTYESFVFREMADIIHAENPITVLKEPLDAEAGIYKYKTQIYIGGDVPTPNELAISVGPPVVTLDDGETVRRMFPNEARIRNLTYSANFQADILVRVTITTPAADASVPTTAGVTGGAAARPMPTATTAGGYTTKILERHFDKFPLFNLPILLRSKLCATHGADTDLLFEMGECRNDQGGYFIIEGAEKLLITRQEQAFNSVYVATKSESDPKLKTYASVICQHPTTKLTRRVALYRLRGNRTTPDNVIRVSLPFVKGAVPLFIVFRALGVESDGDILRMILPDTAAPITAAMEATLHSCVEDARPCLTRPQALEFLRTLTKGFVLADVLNILSTHLFSHVPDRPLARAQYLAEIVRKMIRVEMGTEPPTSRDDIRNQRVLPAGTLLRGLFTDCWKLWKKAARGAVESLYLYNKTLYQGEDFMLIFSPGNIGNILMPNTKIDGKPATLNDSIMRGFRGKWGTNQYNTKVGVIQPMARLSYLDAMSHTRRVVSDFDTSMKLTGPRHLHTSQVGYFCTAETPTGAHIGATKNLSILTAVSLAAPAEPVMNWLFSHGGVIEVSAATEALRATATSVQINGGTIGFTTDPVLLTRVLKMMKWTACLAPTASVSFNTGDNIVRIYLDDGRPLRPLYHLEGGVAPATLLAATAAGTMPRWRDMVCGSLPATAAHTLTSVAFVDPLADNPAAKLADYEVALRDFVGSVEYIDPYEGNEAYISWWGRADNLSRDHTHAEIHPSSLMGLLANMIPFANHNQSPRNQLSCSQSKQGIGYYATNFENRFDTYGSMLCYGEGALCRTIVHDAVGGGNMPYGTNLIFALCSFNGYNQDDGILFNRSSIERGMFRSLALRSYELVEMEDSMTHAVYKIGNPRNVLAWTDLKPGYDYSALDENGVIREGTVVHDRTVLAACYLTNPETREISDASLVPTVFTKGRVDKVVVLHQANGMRLVRVRILEERVPELGDKFSSRHGQKGTMGMLLDAVDMPRTADGMVPDVVVNPHCIPSRMTIAQMLEQVFGKFGAMVGAKINATTFMNDESSYTTIANALESLGVHRDGEEILYSGMTGRMFTCSVFMAPLYFMRLKHLTQDKMNARSAGRREMRTHQPTGGRGNEGGMRIGEMERDSLIAHGITDFLQESMMRRSDGTSFYVCNGCGTIPIYNEAQGLFVCPLCDGPLTFQGDTTANMALVLPVKKSRTTFSKIAMPYALKLLDQEITTYMNAGMRILAEGGARHFREPNELDLDDLLEMQEAQEAAEAVEVEGGAPAINAAIDATRAVIDKISALDKVPGADGGMEDAVADNLDAGQPARNEVGAAPETAFVAPGPEGGAGQPAAPAVIVFHSKTPEYKVFGNFFPVNLMIDGKLYKTAEHYFQSMKFSDHPEIQESIRQAKTPGVAKNDGTKKYGHLERKDWDSYRDTVMLKVIREKFGANHPELRKKLLDTGNAFIKYGSSDDNYWGAGKSGKGKNRLGHTLMEVRDELRRAETAAAVAAARAAVGGGAAETAAGVGGLGIDALLTRPAVDAANAAAAAATANTGGAPAVVIQMGAEGAAQPAAQPQPQAPQPPPAAVADVGEVPVVEAAAPAPVPAPANPNPPQIKVLDLTAATAQPLPAAEQAAPAPAPPAPEFKTVFLKPVEPAKN